MKIPINLASQPFRRDRAMLLASATVSALLVATLGILVSLAISDRAQLADARKEVSRLNRQIRSIAAEQARQDGVLRKPENAEVLERSVFVNSLLKRKGISWSRIFSDLETKVPHNVRVIQIHPTVNGRDEVALDMTVAAESPAPMVEFLRALEAAPFTRPDIRLWQQPTQAEPIFKYRVSVQYAQKL
jgi:type IV pilus assembly protein PilN